MIIYAPPPILRLAFLVSCTGVLFGYGITSIAGVLDVLTPQFGLSLHQTQFLVFILVAGCFVGAIVAGPASTRWGRRPVMGLATLISLGAYGFILTAPSWAGLLTARALTGVSIGLYSMVVPMYAAEAVHTPRRGAIVALFQLAITAGILLSYGLALWLDSPQQWYLVLAFGLAPSLLAVAGLAALPESPRWLSLHAHPQQASMAAHKLGLEDEWQAITQAEARLPHAASKSLRQGSVLKVMLLCSSLFILQNLSGIDGILYYAPQIFKGLGFSAGTAALAATFGLGAVNFLATLASVSLVDQLGRRRLWIVGSAAMVFGLAMVTIAAANDHPWLGLIGLCIYILAFALSLGPLPYVLMSELFPSALREQGMATASAISWLFNALVALTFLSIVETLSLAGTMMLFLGVCILSLILGIKYLPETRNLALETIESRVLEGLPLRQIGG
ncbi:sugar porter family MFS transporter [Castellaniella sp.]|uniref:sugar porter family MFS transporter n=1 Tax=Castellaniella sp. TaxID=1955812 RepID=UPI002AFE0876|nr:sugar porter family MFS transporter [Castellaniella sp.]